MDSTVIEAWKDFYVVAGTAGAAFAAFVYLAVSLHVRIIALNQSDEGLFDLIHTTIFSFVALLIISFGFLWRPSNPHIVSFAIGFASGTVLIPAYEAWRAKERSTALKALGTVAAVIPLAIGIVGLALGVISWVFSYFLYVTPCIVLLLTIFGLANVWNLLAGLTTLEIAAEKGTQEEKRSRRAGPNQGPLPFWRRWVRWVRGSPTQCAGSEWTENVSSHGGELPSMCSATR